MCKMWILVDLRCNRYSRWGRKIAGDLSGKYGPTMVGLRWILGRGFKWTLIMVCLHGLALWWCVQELYDCILVHLSLVLEKTYCESFVYLRLRTRGWTLLKVRILADAYFHSGTNTRKFETFTIGREDSSLVAHEACQPRWFWYWHRIVALALAQLHFHMARSPFHDGALH